MKLHKVIRWEFLNTIRSKQFIIMTIAFPALIAIAIFAITLTEGIGVVANQAYVEPPPPFIVGLMLGFILFIGAFMSGVMAMYAIIKEKQSRVVELMLSSVSAWDLMAGKIIGLGMAGLIQVFTWAATAYFVANRFAPFPLSTPRRYAHVREVGFVPRIMEMGTSTNDLARVIWKENHGTSGILQHWTNCRYLHSAAGQ